MTFLILSLLSIPDPSLFQRVNAVNHEIVTVDRAGHEYRYTPINPYEMSLFERVNAEYTMQEEMLE